jgi:hypothetical protein
MRKYQLPPISVLLLVACMDRASAPAVEQSEAAPQAINAPFIHRVTVGGPDVCEAIGEHLGCDYSFSLVAMEGPQGTSGQWQEGPGRHFSVDCLEVGGNVAWIGGADKDGNRVVVRVVDAGQSAHDPPDSISTAPQDNFTTNTLCHRKPGFLARNTWYAPQGQVRVE